VRDLVQVWAITAPSQPLFPMTQHSLTVLARHSLRQWHRRVWSCLVDVRAVLVVSAYVVIAQAFATLTKAAGPHTSAQRGPWRPNPVTISFRLRTSLEPLQRADGLLTCLACRAPPERSRPVPTAGWRCVVRCPATRWAASAVLPQPFCVPRCEWCVGVLTCAG
jgi:hypothetical protein